MKHRMLSIESEDLEMLWLVLAIHLMHRRDRRFHVFTVYRYDSPELKAVAGRL